MRACLHERDGSRPTGRVQRLTRSARNPCGLRVTTLEELVFVLTVFVWLNSCIASLCVRCCSCTLLASPPQWQCVGEECGYGFCPPPLPPPEVDGAPPECRNVNFCQVRSFARSPPRQQQRHRVSLAACLPLPTTAHLSVYFIFRTELHGRAPKTLLQQPGAWAEHCPNVGPAHARLLPACRHNSQSQ